MKNSNHGDRPIYCRGLYKTACYVIVAARDYPPPPTHPRTLLRSHVVIIRASAANPHRCHVVDAGAGSRAYLKLCVCMFVCVYRLSAGARTRQSLRLLLPCRCRCSRRPVCTSTALAVVVVYNRVHFCWFVGHISVRFNSA